MEDREYDVRSEVIDGTLRVASVRNCTAEYIESSHSCRDIGVADDRTIRER